MERDIRKELLDAIAQWTPTEAQMAALEECERKNYLAREANWWMKWFDALATINRCAAIGSKNYELETLGYLVWLLHKRPMRRKADDFVRPEGEL
jgi:hypothetical protein